MRINPALLPSRHTPPDPDRELAEVIVEAMRLKRVFGPDAAMHLIRHQGDTSWRVQIDIPKGGRL